jgi:hypothetical protein
MLADTNRVAMRRSKEAAWAEVPAAPAMDDMRYTGHGIAHNKTQVSSSEIRSDRQIPSIIETGVTCEGPLNIQFSNKTYKNEILASLGAAAWTVINLAGLTLDVSSVAKTFTRAAGDFVADGVKPGLWVFIGGVNLNAKNKGPFKVTAVVALAITVADPDGVLVTEVGKAASTLKSTYARNGVTPSSFLLEEEFTDINKFIQFFGMRIDQWNMTLAAQRVIEGSFNYFGKTADISAGATVAGVKNAATTTPNVSASAGVAELLLNSAALTAGIKQLTFSLKNNLRHRPVVGSKYDNDIGYGVCQVEITAQALVPDLALFTSVINHADLDIDIPIFDALGNYTIISFPCSKATGNPAVSGQNQDVEIPLTLNTKMHDVLGFTAQVCLQEIP